MDHETKDLIAQLCTRAGMIMEDASAEALTIALQSESDLAAKLDTLIEAIATSSSLLTAARGLTPS